MRKKKSNLIRAALVGTAVVLSGCAIDESQALVDDPGLQTTFDNAGHDGDHGPAPDRDLGAGVSDRSHVGTAGDSGFGSGGPGNSDYGRGSHPDAGGGNGSESTDNGSLSNGVPDQDPGNSGNSQGRSADND